MTFTTVVFMQVLSLFLSIDILDSILAILRESINLQYEMIKEIPNVKKPNVEEILSSIKLFSFYNNWLYASYVVSELLCQLL